MIIIAKILSVILGLVVISKSYFDFKKRNEGLTMFLFWLITWLAVIVFSIEPALIEKINNLIGDQGTGVNTFIGAAYVFLLFVTYRVYTKANRIERKIHDMVTKIGLKDVDEN